MFKNNKVLSIDFGSKYIKCVVGKNNKKNLYIEKVFKFETPEDTLNDGKIYNIKKLAESMKETLKKEKISVKNTIITFNSSTTISREISVPYNNARDFKKLMKFEVQQHFPVVLDEYVTQYKIAEFYKDEGINKARVFAYAIAKDIIGDYFSLINEIGLTPIAFDVHSNVIVKLFSNSSLVNGSNYNKNGTVLLIDFGYKSINIEFVSEGFKKFSRFLPIFETEYLFEKSGDASAHENMDENVINNLYENWADEIDRNIKYYTSRQIGNKIDNIFIHGGFSNLSRIESKLIERLEIPALKIEKLSNVKFFTNKEVNLENYLNAIGAIIER
ncbi:MAG: pilus assembly protein PilM [Alkaliphilus sp.]